MGAKILFLLGKMTSESIRFALDVVYANTHEGPRFPVTNANGFIACCNVTQNSFEPLLDLQSVLRDDQLELMLDLRAMRHVHDGETFSVFGELHFIDGLKMQVMSEEIRLRDIPQTALLYPYRPESVLF